MESLWEAVCRLSANTMLAYTRHLSTHGYGYPGGPWISPLKTGRESAVVTDSHRMISSNKHSSDIQHQQMSATSPSPGVHVQPTIPRVSPEPEDRKFRGSLLLVLAA